MSYDPRVYVQFDGTNWTDITPYVREYEIARGRSYELDDMEAGTLTLTLDNEDGRFTPRKVTSPYYPNVRPRRAVKVVNEAVGTVVEYYGFIERWPVTVGQAVSTVRVNAVDVLANVAQIEAKRPVAELIMAAEPHRYYPLSDGLNSPVAGDWGNDGSPAAIYHSKYGGAGNIGGAGLLTRGEGTNGGCFFDGSGSFNAGSGLRLTDLPSTNMGDRLSIFLFLKVPDLTGTRVIWSEWSESKRLREVRLQADGNFIFDHLNGAGDLYGSMGANAPITTDTVYLVHIWTESEGYSGAAAFGLDVYSADSPLGTPVASISATALTRTTLPTKDAFIGPHPTQDFAAMGYWSRYVSNVVVNYGVASSGAGDPLADGLHQALRADPLDDASYFDFLATALTRSSSAVYGTDVPTMLYYPDWSDGVNGRDLIRQFEDATGGIVYADTSNVLAYRTRHDRIGQAPAMTFSESGAALDGDLLFEVDEARIVNDTTVNRLAGGEFKSIDSASVAEYDRHTRSLLMDIVDQLEAQAAAEWSTYLGSDPLVRCDRAVVNVAAQPTYAVDISILDIGDKITLADLPTAAPYATADFFIEGITRRVVVAGGTPEHEVEFQLSPADRYNGWVLGDAAFGLLDSTAIALY